MNDEETQKTEISKISHQAALVATEDDETIIEKYVLPSQKSNPWLAGVRYALPVMIGFLPLSFAFGVMAKEAGLPFLATFLMSLVVFAGASQYIAVGLIAVSEPILSLVFTTFIVNLRHLLLSTALAPHLKSFSFSKRLLFGLELTDESFLLHSTWFKRHQAHPNRAIGTNMGPHLAWLTGTLLGYGTGSLIHNLEFLGLDYALPAMFIAMVVLQIKERSLILVSALCGSLPLLFYSLNFKTGAVILATLIGASVGLLLEQCRPKTTST